MNADQSDRSSDNDLDETGCMPGKAIFACLVVLYNLLNGLWPGRDLSTFLIFISMIFAFSQFYYKNHAKYAIIFFVLGVAIDILFPTFRKP